MGKFETVFMCSIIISSVVTGLNYMYVSLQNEFPLSGLTAMNTSWNKSKEISEYTEWGSSGVVGSQVEIGQGSTLYSSFMWNMISGFLDALGFKAFRVQVTGMLNSVGIPFWFIDFIITMTIASLIFGAIAFVFGRGQKDV